MDNENKNTVTKNRKAAYIVSWVLNFVYSFAGWFMYIVEGLDNNSRVMQYFDKPLELQKILFGDLLICLIIFAILIVINALIVFIFHKKKIYYNKVIYWIVTLLIALPPYIHTFYNLAVDLQK